MVSAGGQAEGQPKEGRLGGSQGGKLRGLAKGFPFHYPSSWTKVPLVSFVKV